MATTFPMTLPHAPTGFVNQAALDTAFTTPINDLAALVAQGYLGEASSSSAVTLSTTSAFAGLAPVTFTLAVQRRVKISVNVRYNPAGAATARYQTRPGYNTGSSASIGSFSPVGVVSDDTETTVQQGSAFGLGTALLAAGTYTAYASVTRIFGGASGDVANVFYTLVEDCGGS